MSGTKRKWSIGLLLTYAFLLFMVAVTLYPILWVIGSSLNPGTSLFSSTLIPKNATLDHYVWLFTSPDSQYLVWYKNTLKISLINAAVSVILTTGTAYAFSRYRFFGRKYGLVAFLVLQMFPQAMSMVALYILLNEIGLLDTHLGLILVYAGAQIPFNTWLVKGYFDTIPRGVGRGGADRRRGAQHGFLPDHAPLGPADHRRGRPVQLHGSDDRFPAAADRFDQSGEMDAGGGVVRVYQRQVRPELHRVRCRIRVDRSAHRPLFPGDAAVFHLGPHGGGDQGMMEDGKGDAPC